MISLRPASVEDLGIITSIANRTWPATYQDILSREQLDYMLALFYSAEALTANIANGHHFVLAVEDGIPKGFIGLEHHYNQKGFTHIHKIYVLPEAQRKGIGQLLLEEAFRLAKANDSTSMSLNVNRSNPARFFYEKQGFSVKYSVNITLDHGYLMEDYLMEKSLFNL